MLPVRKQVENTTLHRCNPVRSRIKQNTLRNDSRIVTTALGTGVSPVDISRYRDKPHKTDVEVLTLVLTRFNSAAFFHQQRHLHVRAAYRLNILGDIDSLTPALFGPFFGCYSRWSFRFALTASPTSCSAFLRICTRSLARQVTMRLTKQLFSRSEFIHQLVESVSPAELA